MIILWGLTDVANSTPKHKQTVDSRYERSRETVRIVSEFPFAKIVDDCRTIPHVCQIVPVHVAMNKSAIDVEECRDYV